VKSDVSVNWILGGNLLDITAVNPGIINKEQLKEPLISLKVYPSPATDFINIEITPVDIGRLILELYNISGVKVLDKIAVKQSVMQLNISNIPSGVYFLKVLGQDNNQLFGVEKIIKN